MQDPRSQPRDWLVNRAPRPAVALETTLLVHGVPPDRSRTLADQIAQAVRAAGAFPAMIGLLNGAAIVGLTDGELDRLIQGPTAKVNRSNLGLTLHARSLGATTVSTTLELAARAGIRVCATGGIGGVHPGLAQRLDISSDLAALAAHPVAVVTSGCKSILDIHATRELLETLGIPVVGYRCDTFPAFYQRGTDLPVDARFDDPDDLARFIAPQLARSRRGVVVCNPVPEEQEIPEPRWRAWLEQARLETQTVAGRDSTPAVLSAVHRLSRGITVDANIALATDNAALAGLLAARMASR